ncbi:nuclear transport factor 2 family protein [Pleomorphomonas oryzae]|uniref:nuclear transport factor 2 family protein n=1 Tax=Pleomorphomonas oryzae TaxID=261934 RepID=UPI000425702D|nr:nuclear transport factor 2 family protein [Pleomorphomonas oryzae]
MSQDIATLIDRNLQGVFGEGDAALRRATAAEIYADDVVFVEPHGVYRGRDEVVRTAGVIRAKHPSFRYEVIAPVEVLRDAALHQEIGRAKWVSGAPGEPPAYAGTDVVLARDGRITAIYMFFDGLPDPTH